MELIEGHNGGSTAARRGRDLENIIRCILLELGYNFYSFHDFIIKYLKQIYPDTPDLKLEKIRKKTWPSCVSCPKIIPTLDTGIISNCFEQKIVISQFPYYITGTDKILVDSIKHSDLTVINQKEKTACRIECKNQTGGGSVDEKFIGIPSTYQKSHLNNFCRNNVLVIYREQINTENGHKKGANVNMINLSKLVARDYENLNYNVINIYNDDSNKIIEWIIDNNF